MEKTPGEYGLSWDPKMERRAKKRSEGDAPPRQILRGDKCLPNVPLAKLKNVGKGNLTGNRIAFEIPFVKLALELLNEDPIRPGADLRGIATRVEDAPNAEKWGLHLDHFLDTEALRIVHKSELTLPDGSLELRIFCRYKGVHKEIFDARGIFDLIDLNAVCSSREVVFTLLSGRAFVEVLRTIPFREKGMRIFHGDLTNSYYQFAIGKNLGRRINIRRGLQILEAQVLAMGFSKACGITQGLVWGVILRRLDGDEDLGVAEEVYGRTDAPGYIRLASGGIIVLIYDSILVIDTEKGAKAWSERIVRNMYDANLVLKYAILEGRKTLVDENGVEQGPVYGGAQFRYDESGLTWKLQDTSLMSWKERVTRPLASTPRTLYKLVGYLRFVYGILDFYERHLGRWSKLQSKMGNDIKNWDTPSVADTHITELCAIILGLTNERRHANSFKKDVGGPVRVGYVAVDATTKRYAFCEFKDGSVVRRHGIVMTKSVKFGGSDEWDVERRIEYGEAMALESGVDFLIKRGFNVVIVAGDNQSVGFGFRKGYARNDETDVVIGRTVTNAGTAAVVIMDIDTDENYGDIPSRPDEVYTEVERDNREAATWRALKRGFELWKEANAVYVLRVKLEKGN